jgi:ankyrin repeat protein
MGQSEDCDTAVMNLLFDHGADPNWRHDSGHIWLHKAAYSGWRVSPEVKVAWISTLIECGADINAATDAGQTLLHTS